MWAGEPAMRISVSNWRTSENDIDRSAASILEAHSRAQRRVKSGGYFTGTANSASSIGHVDFDLFGVGHERHDRFLAGALFRDVERKLHALDVAPVVEVDGDVERAAVGQMQHARVTAIEVGLGIEVHGPRETALERHRELQHLACRVSASRPANATV